MLLRWRALGSFGTPHSFGANWRGHGRLKLSYGVRSHWVTTLASHPRGVSGRLMQHRDGPEPCQTSLCCSVDSRLRLPPSHAGFSTSRCRVTYRAGSHKSLLSSKLVETPRVGSRRSDKPRSDTPSPRAGTYVATTGKATVKGPAFSPITNSRSRDSALLTPRLINLACSGVVRSISRSRS